MVIGCQQGVTNAVLPFHSLETIEQFLGLLFVQFEFGTNQSRVAAVKTVFRKLLLLHQADVAVSFVRGPTQIVDALHALKKRADALEAVSELHGDGIEIDASALLEVSELGDLKTVEQNLPADAPGAQGRRFPVVLLESNVVLLEVDADGAQAPQVNVLNIDRRGLEDYLKLGMLIQPVGVLAVAAVGGPTTGLNISDAISVRAEHAQESFRVHCACAYFDVVRLLQDATLLHPKVRELQNQILEIEALRFFLKFYFSFQVVSKSSRVINRRSTWCSIQASPASRNSLALSCMDCSYSMRSSRSPAKRSARFLASGCSGFIPERRHFSQKRPDWCAS